jgi:hypothetical protein
MEFTETQEVKMETGDFFVQCEAAFAELMEREMLTVPALQRLGRLARILGREAEVGMRSRA